ncbi:tRNA(uracil-5)-methyltransferase [Halogeometricum pallidum JCM 14848]|uniref:tRNA(Uracil-5)-methyltransferase n=1 Tax=Halogeometricum pallidum JCM 14848 TaxID=1227487 RepID=M0D6Z5_HALPD|nr:TRAM domain-containing protein [Halogeometricum pallidum]ELZ30452.1 tRNA(uracil-5)-methyltransferase [Halogeometricum pallidum JCM 14848]
MSDCPLADECPRYSERINGMGCQYYGDRAGAEWCNSYEQPIRDLKQQPVKPGEDVVVTVDDIHESGAGVGRTEDGFIVLVDGLLPTTRAVVRIDRVKSNHAKSKKVVERLPTDPDEEAGDADAAGRGGDGDGNDDGDDSDDDGGNDKGSGPKRPTALGSRDNFWGS